MPYYGHGLWCIDCRSANLGNRYLPTCKYRTRPFKNIIYLSPYNRDTYNYLSPMSASKASLFARPAASGTAVNGTQHSHTACSHLTSLTTCLANFPSLHHNKEHDTTPCDYGQTFRAQESDRRLQLPSGHGLPRASIPSILLPARLNRPVRRTTSSQPSEPLTGYAALLVLKEPYFLVITKLSRCNQARRVMHVAAGRKWLCKAFPEPAEDGTLNHRYIYSRRRDSELCNPTIPEDKAISVKSDGFTRCA